MPGFLDNLQELGANINAPMAADPNLNLAGLLLGAGMLQPTQPGSTPGAVFGNALTNSLGFLTKQRGEQAKLAQEANIAKEKIGVEKGQTAAYLEAAGIRGTQDQRQFEMATEQRRQQHEETLAAHRERIAALTANKEMDRTKLQLELDKNVDAAYASMIEANPASFAKRDASGNAIKDSFDREGFEFMKTRDKNMARRSAGLPIMSHAPYGSDIVDRTVKMAVQNPNAYFQYMQEAVNVYGEKFQEDVAEAIHRIPPISTRKTEFPSSAGPVVESSRFEPTSEGGEGIPGIASRVHKAISPPDAFIKTDTGEELLQPGKMVTIDGKQYKAVAPAGKGRWQLLNDKGIARFYRVDRVGE